MTLKSLISKEDQKITTSVLKEITVESTDLSTQNLFCKYAMSRFKGISW